MYEDGRIGQCGEIGGVTTKDKQRGETKGRDKIKTIAKRLYHICKYGVKNFKLCTYFFIKQRVKEMYQIQNYNYHCQQVVLF